MVFYATQILSSGPLRTVWVAAHLDRQLKRQQIAEANITTSVDAIVSPDAPLALRLSGQLLLGVVRVYARKVCVYCLLMMCVHTWDGACFATS